jgi:multicomponent Na+:H+ antiporter subunit G
MNVFDLLSWLALLGGIFFMVVGGVGTLRLPDFYTRMHAAGMTDTLGAGLILVGLMFQGGLTQVTVKLILILLLLGCTSPVATYALARAAFADPENPRPLLAEDLTQKEPPPSNS